MNLIDRDSLGVGMANPAVFENRAHADGWNSLFTILQQAPVVDAEPVRHGRWVRENDFDSFIDVPWLCSECNQKLLLGGLLTPYGYGYHYCPNCGAKMDGGLPQNVGYTTGGAEDEKP